MTVAGTATGTYYWIRSRPNPQTWAAGSTLIAMVVAAGTPTGALHRVATGVVTGALISLLT